MKGEFSEVKNSAWEDYLMIHAMKTKEIYGDCARICFKIECMFNNYTLERERITETTHKISIGMVAVAMAGSPGPPVGTSEFILI